MMKKKSRRAKSNQTQSTASISGEKKPSGQRGRPRKNVPVTRDQFYLDNPAEDRGADFSVREAPVQPKHAGRKPRSAGRLTAALCRLCHGKFSPRSLRHAFNWPQDAADIIDVESEATVPSPLLFHTDFQRLVGVQLDRDPSLSEFICKKCHAKFYKCHSILIRFLQRVNLPPFEKDNVKKNVKCPDSFANHSSTIPASFTSDPKCLHNLVSWAHHHGEACRSCPGLKEVLEGQCWGSVKAVWGCVDGHSYIMDTRCQDNPGYPMNMGSDTLAGNRADAVMSDEEEVQDVEEVDERQPGGNGRISHVQHSPAVDSAELPHWAGNSEDFTGHEDALSPAPAQLEDRAASDLSDRAMSEDDFEESRKLSDDDLFEPSHSDKRIRKMSVPNKRRQSPKAQEEPKIKKKPGPKPGWKNKFKPKGEELPNIYKCPYQGCTAVYKAPDGLKKHIKEHHEEVRERPCPHPGCNKVFMIDRYLQRHVKLIHTEERNYICDQCGQTFKQRKHLSVHQLRHSGAKPLQCEICGFQCRQRASLKYHMTKHKAEADLEFACLICEKRFEKAHNLNVHMSMVHPLTLVEAQRGSGQQQQQQQQPLYDLHTISLTGEVVQQDQDR